MNRIFKVSVHELKNYYIEEPIGTFYNNNYIPETGHYEIRINFFLIVRVMV